MKADLLDSLKKIINEDTKSKKHKRRLDTDENMGFVNAMSGIDLKNSHKTQNNNEKFLNSESHMLDAIQDKLEHSTKNFVKKSHESLKKEFSGQLEDICQEFKKQFASNKNNFETMNDKVISEIEKLKEDNSMIYQALTGLNQRLEKTEMNVFRYECDHEDFKLKLDENSKKIFILSNEQDKKVQNFKTFPLGGNTFSAKKMKEILSGKKYASSIETPLKKDSDNKGENLADKEKIVDAVEDIKETQEDMNDILLDITNRFVKLENHVYEEKIGDNSDEMNDLKTQYDSLHDDFKKSLELIKQKFSNFTQKSDFETLTQSMKENLKNIYDELKKIEIDNKESSGDLNRELELIKNFNQKFVTSEHLSKSVELLEVKIKSELNYAYNMELFRLKGSSNSYIKVPKSSEKKHQRDSSEKPGSNRDNNITLTNNETLIFRELASNLEKKDLSQISKDGELANNLKNFLNMTSELKDEDYVFSYNNSLSYNMNSELNKENAFDCNSNGKFNKTFKDKKIEILMKELPEIIKSIRSSGKTTSLSSEKKRFDNRNSNRSPLKELSEYRKISFQLSPSELEYNSLKLKASKSNHEKLNNMKDSRAILFKDDDVSKNQNILSEQFTNCMQNDINNICEQNRSKTKYEMNIRIDGQNNIEVCNKNQMYASKNQNINKPNELAKNNKQDTENFKLNMDPELINQVINGNNSSHALTTNRNSSLPNSNAKSYERLNTNTSKNSDATNPLLKHYDMGQGNNIQYFERNFDVNNKNMQAFIQQNKDMNNLAQNITDNKITRMHFMKIDEPVKHQTLDSLAYSHKTIKETSNEVGTQNTPQPFEKLDTCNPNNDSFNADNDQDFEYEINIKPHILSTANSKKKQDFDNKIRTHARNSVTSNRSASQDKSTSFMENRNSLNASTNSAAVKDNKKNKDLQKYIMPLSLNLNNE